MTNRHTCKHRWWWLLGALASATAFARAGNPAPSHAPEQKEPAAAPHERDGGSQRAFERSVRKIMPLTPAQILEFEQRLDATRKAIHDGPPPNQNKTIKLAPILRRCCAERYASCIV